MQQSLSPTYSPPVTTVPFTGSAQNPLEPPVAPSIYWYMNVVINESTPSAPTAYVVPSHTCYPAHVVKVNGTVVYSYTPTRNDPFYLVECLAPTNVLPLVTVQQGTYQVGTQ
jgi:hypothetical protein